MEEKMIDLSKTVHELCNQNVDLLEVLGRIGFTDITKPGMLNTVGRFMTLPKGAKAKNIDLEYIKKELIKEGYSVKDI